MVHLKKCLYEKGRGNPITEFYKIVDGKRKPQIYCLGWIDSMTDAPLEICKNCKDGHTASSVSMILSIKMINGIKSCLIKQAAAEVKGEKTVHAR